MSLRHFYNLESHISNSIISFFLGCCFSVCNIASLRLEIDGSNRGCRTIRLESNLSEMDHLIKVALDPLEFMCQAVGVNTTCKDKLDEALAKQLKSNMPQNGLHLLKGEMNSDSLANVTKGKLLFVKFMKFEMGKIINFV